MADLLERIRRAGRPPFESMDPVQAREAYAQAAEVLDLPRAALHAVRDLQVPPSATAPLDGEVGAIAYDRAGYDGGEAGGIDDTERDQWRRTSAQAGPALGFLRVADCA